MIRVPVEPSNVEVLGNKVKATDVMWTGLDMAKAEPRVQSTLWLAIAGQEEAPLDIHLCVPWEHPEDKKDGIDSETRYRVRPRMQPGKRWKGQMVKSVAFEMWDGKWYIAYSVEPPKHKSRS